MLVSKKINIPSWCFKHSVIKRRWFVPCDSYGTIALECKEFLSINSRKWSVNFWFANNMILTKINDRGSKKSLNSIRDCYMFWYIVLLVYSPLSQLSEWQLHVEADQHCVYSSYYETVCCDVNIFIYFRLRIPE